MVHHRGGWSLAWCHKRLLRASLSPPKVYHEEHGEVYQ